MLYSWMSPPSRSRRRSVVAGGGRRGRLGWVAGLGRSGAERAVRPMPVVVVDELVPDMPWVSMVRDQDPIEALASDGAEESLSDGVCLWGPDRRADHTHALSVEDRVEGSRELAVVVADQELERSLAVGEREHEAPGLLGRPCAVWVLGPAGEVHAPG